MEDVSKKLYQILEESCNSCKSNMISLSGGLDSSIIAHFLKGKNPKGVAIISEDFVSTDLTYCQMISKGKYQDEIDTYPHLQYLKRLKIQLKY